MLEHGGFKMYIENQTIVVEPIGAWNIETALRYGREFKLLVNQIENEEWATLVIFLNFELAGPKMWEHINKLNEWGIQHNKKHEVVVCTQSIHKEVIKLTHKYTASIEPHFVETVKQAKDNLRKHGYLKS